MITSKVSKLVYSWAARIAVPLAAAGLTLLYFLILPLLENLAHPPEEQTVLRSFDVADQPPPPPPPEIEEEKKPEEPDKPKLDDNPEPLDLTQLSTALNAGEGGDWSGGFAIDLGQYMKGNSGTEGAFSMGEVDQQPRPIYQPSPEYPPALRRQGIGGTVCLFFLVNTEGRVDKIKTVSSSNPILEREALTAVKKWKFEPARKNGKTVAFHMRVPITFSPN